MPKLKIKKGDTVVVLTGNDKGKTGEIIKTMPSEGKVIVQGINLVKKHQKPSQTNPGGIVTKEAAIDASNVSLLDPKSGKATKVGYKTVGDKKVRVARLSGEVIDK